MFVSFQFLFPARPITINNVTTYGYRPTSKAVVLWSKRGQTCVYIPGHDPPRDITIFMDISVNPGPVGSDINEGLLDFTGTHQNTNLTASTLSTCTCSSISTRCMYSRNDLPALRFVSLHWLDPAKLQLLKMNSILRYRGKHAGQRRKNCKITVLITNRLS